MNLTQINFVGKLDYHRMWLYLYYLIFNLLVLSYFSHWLLCRLLLDNVTLETSGDYRCQVTKKIYLDFEIKIDAKNKKIFKIELMWGERKIFKIWMELGKSHTIKGGNVYYEKFGQLIYQRITKCHQSLAGQSHHLAGERRASWRCSVAVWGTTCQTAGW